MKDYKYIIFDLDGTLVDSKRGIFNSARYAFEKMNWTLPPEDVLLKFIGPPLHKSFSAVGGGSTPEETEQAVEYYREIYNKKGAFECDLYPRIKDLIYALKADGRKIALATAKSERGAIAVLTHLNILADFDFVSGAPADKSRNEKNEIIDYAIKQFGIKLDEAVMIGDRFYDAVGAKLCGIDCIGATYGYGTPDELTQNGAIALAKNVEELAALLKVNL